MWITVKQAAKFANCSVSAIQKGCKSNKYVCRCVDGLGRGGKQYEILLESLPPAAVEEYNNQMGQQQHPNSDRPEWCSGNQWSEAERKARIVMEYQSSDMKADDFIRQYNQSHNLADNLTRQKLFSYQRKYKSGGIAALIDTRGGATGGVPITEEMWDYFYSLYMTQQKRSIKLCYDLTKAKFKGIPFPSVSSFERKARKIDAYALTMYRSGEHALKDSLPSMKRDKSSINSNDIWFSDHHAMDVFVKNEKNKIYRPWLTTFFDARSNKIVSFIVREEDPNAAVIKRCLKIGINSCGIPQELYFDNGKDYRSNQFDNDFPLSIVQQLGMKCIHATPYHGQAKTVERFFGILEDRFGKLFPTYTGKDNKNRPEQMRISNEKIAKIAPTTEEFKQAITEFIDQYNAAPNGGDFMDGDSPNNVFAKNLKNKVTINEDALNIVCSTVEIRTVHKNGVDLLKNTYYDIALIPYFKQKVIVRYLPENIDEVYIFDMENKFICKALAKRVTAYRHTTEDDYINAQKERRAVLKHVRELAPKRNVSLQELIALKQFEEIAETSNPETIESVYVNPQAENAAAAVRESKETKMQNHRKVGMALTMNQYYENIKKAGG